jgi:hypothetical protein
VPFEADYTCTPQPVTESRFMAAKAIPAGRDKLILTLHRAAATPSIHLY